MNRLSNRPEYMIWAYSTQVPCQTSPHRHLRVTPPSGVQRNLADLLQGFKHRENSVYDVCPAAVLITLGRSRTPILEDSIGSP